MKEIIHGIPMYELDQSYVTVMGMTKALLPIFYHYHLYIGP